ncbi:MAG: hypothetical protein EBV09_02310, partial [Actinobacteria bacterium]|nr:hypothetical protein [Actinomycetota bacterium]
PRRTGAGALLELGHQGHAHRRGQHRPGRVREHRPNRLIVKKRINEIAFAPLAEHGALFDQVNQDLSAALTHVEGISSQSPS